MPLLPRLGVGRPTSRPYRPRPFQLFACCLLLVLISLLPVAPAPTADHAADAFPSVFLPSVGRAAPPAVVPAQQANVPPIEVAHLQGVYSPNTTILWNDGALWFFRPPYQSQLLPVGDGTYTFAEGWLAGTAMQFAPNDTGGLSILILASDGNWSEFARSGEIYPDLQPDLRQALERVLDETVTQDNVPGALLYTFVPGQGMWMGARGVADQGRGIPMVPLDRVRVASVTKTFVATVVLQLVQEGRLTFDDTVEQWLPGTVPNGDRMTLYYLLNHTSGVYDYLTNGFVNRVLQDRNRVWRPEELVASAVAQPAYFEPGEPGQWRYSNTNYILLGMIVERATGNSLANEIRQRILAPLGMNNTYLDTYESLPGNLARGYVSRRDYTDINLSFAWAAGGMVSTSEDLGRFAQGVFGGALLGPEARAMMLTFVNANGSWDSPDLGYGLGVMQNLLDIRVADKATAGAVWGHTGGLTGYRTVMWYMPQNGVTVVAAVNQMYADPNEIATRAVDTIYEYNPWLIPGQ